MELIYTGENIKKGKSIFLAGPTLRGDNSNSWRKEAVKKLEQFGYDGIIYIPEYRNGRKVDSYIDVASWENKALSISTLILFWIPRDKNKLPGFTTNVEFGHFIESGRVIYGRPDDSYKVKYLDFLYKDVTNKDPINNIEELLKESIKEANLKYKKEESISEIIDRLKRNKDFIRDLAKVLTREEKNYILGGIINKKCENCDKENNCTKIYHYDCPFWENDYEIGCAKIFKAIRSK